MSRVSFNLNEYVYVRLTPRALSHMESKYSPDDWPHVKPKVDEQGYSQIQMWKFIDYFGHLFRFNGADMQLWFEDGMDVQFSRDKLKRVGEKKKMPPRPPQPTEEPGRRSESWVG